jgi:hypothetical protein
LKKARHLGGSGLCDKRSLGRDTRPHRHESCRAVATHASIVPRGRHSAGVHSDGYVTRQGYRARAPLARACRSALSGRAGHTGRLPASHESLLGLTLLPPRREPAAVRIEVRPKLQRGLAKGYFDFVCRHSITCCEGGLPAVFNRTNPGGVLTAKLLLWRVGRLGQRNEGAMSVLSSASDEAFPKERMEQ